VASEVGETWTLVIERHQVPVVDVGIHLFDRQDRVALWASWRGDTKIEMVALCVGCSVLIVGLARSASCIEIDVLGPYLPAALDGVNEVGCIDGVFGVFPIDVKPVQPQISNQRQRAITELLPSSLRRKRRLEIGSKAPSAD
jgi:hypothetical protein